MNTKSLGIGVVWGALLLGLLPQGAECADVVKPAAPLQSPEGNSIITMDQKNNVEGLPVMTFYVRFPKGVKPKGKVDGVLLDVTHLKEKASLEYWIKRPSKLDVNFQFADQHKLAVVTWTTATMYSKSDSFVVDEADERDPYNEMEGCFRTWKIAMDRLCRDYGLPENNYLIYGYSRGAQWAHRIVLRCPERFLGVHIHINSSFAEPTENASRCLWLLTTGELEHGNKAAKIFYQKGLSMHYPIMLRVYPGKAHEVFPEEENLGIKFFEYVLKLKTDQQRLLAAKQTTLGAAALEDQSLIFDESLLANFQKPLFYGDILNGDVYPASQQDMLSESQRVGLPDLGIAKAWGYFHP